MGAVVYLTDKILKEGGYDFPRRLSYGLVTKEQIYSNQFRENINPIEYKATIRRAVDVEDTYLKSKNFKSASRTPPGSRYSPFPSARVSPLLSDK